MTSTPSFPASFSSRWAALAARRTPFCLGVAPSGKWLRKWGLSDDVTGLRAYCDIVLEASSNDVAGFKVQPPFFTRFGAAGYDLLRQFTVDAQARGSIVVLDAKLGDADDTMDSLAASWLGPESHLRADAVTANAYMGFASLAPLLKHAAATGTAVFVLARTSNHASRDVQGAALPDGRTVAESLIDEVARWNSAEDTDAAAAVIGARLPESMNLARRAAGALLEVPGLGRHDRDTPEVLAPAAVIRHDRLLLPVTTGVLQHGPDPAALRRSIAHWKASIVEQFASMPSAEEGAVWALSR